MCFGCPTLTLAIFEHENFKDSFRKISQNYGGYFKYEKYQNAIFMDKTPLMYAQKNYVVFFSFSNAYSKADM